MSLKKNIVGLAVAQIFTYIVPLLQFPYLSRHVGQADFGVLIYTLSLIQIALLITDFGFDISIAKNIAEGKNGRRRLGTYLYQTMCIKTILMILSLMIVFICFYLTKMNKSHVTSGYYAYAALAIIFNTYNPRWFFQGTEKIYIYANIVIVGRLSSLLLIFFMIKDANDIVYYPAIMFVQAMMTTCPCLLYIYKMKIYVVKTSLKSVVVQFKYSLEYFLSRVSVALYSSGCSVFLGTFGNSMQQVAIYGVAEQLYKAGVQVFNPVISALIPYMVRTKNYPLFNRIVCLFLFITACGMLIGFYFGADIIRMIYGAGFEQSQEVLNVFMVVILASVLGMLFGYPALLPLGLGSIANKSVFISGFLQILMLGYLLLKPDLINARNLAITYLICDWLMFIIRGGYFAINKGRNHERN